MKLLMYLAIFSIAVFFAYDFTHCTEREVNQDLISSVSNGFVKQVVKVPSGINFKDNGNLYMPMFLPNYTMWYHPGETKSVEEFNCTGFVCKKMIKRGSIFILERRGKYTKILWSSEVLGK